MAETGDKLEGLLIGLTVGTVLGAVLGLLFAPAPGQETRKKLKDVMDTIPDRARKTTDKVKEMLHRRKEGGEEPESVV